jgi:hypothetical protein
VEFYDPNAKKVEKDLKVTEKKKKEVEEDTLESMRDVEKFEKEQELL